MWIGKLRSLVHFAHRGVARACSTPCARNVESPQTSNGVHVAAGDGDARDRLGGHDASKYGSYCELFFFVNEA